MEEINLKERFTIGIIAGVLSSIAMNAMDLLAYALHLTTVRFIDFSSIVLYSTKPTSPIEYIQAGLAQMIFSSALTVGLVFLLPVINTKRYLLKGVAWGTGGWFVIYAVSSLYKIPKISGLPWQTALENMIGAAIFGLVAVYTIRFFYSGKEEWSGHAMEDRFTAGFLAGGIAGIIQVLLDFLMKVFHLGKVRLLDYAAVLLYSAKPKFWLDTALAQIAYLSFTCASGVLFAYLIKGVGSKNHLLKGWFFAIISWFAVFAIGTMYKIQLVNKVPWQESVSNFITTSIFGLIMAVALKYLIEGQKTS